jgi:acyl-CoA synthetase (AMP-forming)/AMP-acid ligase II
MELADHLREVFSLDRSAWAVEFEGTQYSWGELSDLADLIGHEIEKAGAKQYDVVGWAAQNEASAVATLAAAALYEHCACTLNPHLATKILTEELRTQRFPVIVGDAKFWAIPGLVDAAKDAGSAGIVVTWKGKTATAVPYPGLERVGPGSHREPLPDAVIEPVSSGTTGAPKRSPQSRDATMNALILGQRSEGGTKQAKPTLKRSPAILFRSLAHGGGQFAVLLALYSGRPLSLHEKFSVDTTIDAIRRYKPKVTSFVPTMIQMIWDANVPPESLSSLIAIRSGTAPLDPALQEKFEEKYGIPILVDYGASEFGGVTTWSLADHKEFAKKKRGSVGRVVAGAQLRVIDQETRKEITDGRIGLLEVLVPTKQPDWITTTDLVTIDSDGFLFIHGRADDAIVRGGFKILPEEVAKVLRLHPDVQDAAVVGVADARLGQVPVAVVEKRPGRSLDEAALKAFARDHLTPYQVPVAFKFTEKLPRSASTKIVKSEVLKLAQG